MPATTCTAEEALIGVMLLTPKAVHVALDTVSPRDFTEPTLRTIYEAIIALHVIGSPVNPVSVAGALYYAGNLDEIGGHGRLLSLQALAPATYRAAEFAAEIGRHTGTRAILGRPVPDADGVYRPAQVGVGDDMPLVTIIPDGTMDGPIVHVRHLSGNIGEVWTAAQAHAIADALHAAADAAIEEHGEKGLGDDG